MLNVSRAVETKGEAGTKYRVLVVQEGLRWGGALQQWSVLNVKASPVCPPRGYKESQWGPIILFPHCPECFIHVVTNHSSLDM